MKRKGEKNAEKKYSKFIQICRPEGSFFPKHSSHKLFFPVFGFVFDENNKKKHARKKKKKKLRLIREIREEKGKGEGRRGGEKQKFVGNMSLGL